MSNKFTKIGCLVKEKACGIQSSMVSFILFKYSNSNKYLKD